MMAELHLVVIWNRAICKERELLDAISSCVKVLDVREVAWPCDVELGFRTFYGVKLKTAAMKVRECGAGPFRVVVVCDEHPRYEERNTSRGIEVVNATMFDLKSRCRELTGGGHKVHASNSPEEARRDILVLTGHRLEEWCSPSPPAQCDCSPFPGSKGWRSLRDMFAFLNDTAPYAVIRNSETLPDRHDPAVHGDIDFLVEDEKGVANLLGARKVHAEPYRVHYEVQVGGAPLRIDLRHIGDDYYCEEWERDILARRRLLPGGVYVPSAEDGFFALVYHALYQKPFVAADYAAKAKALADEAGIGGASFDEWLPMLERFLEKMGYSVPRPADHSVKFNAHVVAAGQLSRRVLAMVSIDGLRLSHLGAKRGNPALPTLLFEGAFRGVPCYVKYALSGESVVRREWNLAEKARRFAPDNCVRPLWWHADGRGGAVIVTEKVEGVPLSELLDSQTALGAETTSRIARDMLKIADALSASGVVHRDIRPDNLVVGSDGRVAVIDFQMAADRSSPVECGYVAARHYELLRLLGGRDAHPDGMWNDRLAMLACVRMLSPSKAREEVEEALSRGADGELFVACLPRRMRRGVLLRLWRMRLELIACAVLRRKFGKAKRLAHYAAVASKWRFA